MIIRILRRSKICIILNREISACSTALLRNTPKLYQLPINNKIQKIRCLRGKFYARFESSVCDNDKTEEPTEKCDNEEEGKEEGSDGNDDDLEELEIEYFLGRPRVDVPLPSREMDCRFILNPVTQTVDDFAQMIIKEDPGVDKIIFLTMDDVRIASSVSIQNLILEDFKMSINDVDYVVNCPHVINLDAVPAKNIAFMRQYVEQLYEAMNVKEFDVLQEKELLKQREAIKLELIAYESKRKELDVKAENKTRLSTWLVLTYMSIQCGLLARLTWWEYSWDIMEPVTYFVTYGTTVAAVAYFLLTNVRYDVDLARDRAEVLNFYDAAKKMKFDTNEYNRLKKKMAVVERLLADVQDPLKFKPSEVPKLNSGIKGDNEKSG